MIYMINNSYDNQSLNVILNSTPSIIDYIELILTILFYGLTTFVAFLTYKLQKQVKKDNDKDKQFEIINYASNIYYFLNDIIYKMADTEFTYDVFSNISIDNKDFMKSINYLRNRVINNKEFLFLRELYFLYNGLKNDPQSNYKNFKILYKRVIDNNINPIKIKELRNNNKINDITSFPLLIIMKKLEIQMNNKIEEYSEGMLESKYFNGNLFIRKNYSDKYYLEYKNENIFGIVQQYEIVLFFKKPQITSTSELKYEGEIDNNLYNGKGKYFYYTTQNGFNYTIDSCMLKEKDINFDYNAQLIKETLEKYGVKNAHAVYEGIFEKGKIKDGKLGYKEKAEDDFIEINLHV